MNQLIEYENNHKALIQKESSFTLHILDSSKFKICLLLNIKLVIENRKK